MRSDLDDDQSTLAIPVSRTRTLDVIVDAVPDLSSVVELIQSSLGRRTPLLVTFVNPYSRAIVRRKPEFLDQLNAFDLVLPDGIGMSVAIRWLHQTPAERISFDMTSLAPEVMKLAVSGGRGIVLVGGVPGCAEQAAERLMELFPTLKIVGSFDGYGAVEERVAQIAELDPDIVIASMGAGAQEEILLGLVQTGWRGCGFTSGGFFDQIGKRAHYYPSWVDRFHLRWAYRLAREPRRLWRRYLLMYPPFVAALFSASLTGLILRLGQRAAHPDHRRRHSVMRASESKSVSLQGRT